MDFKKLIVRKLSFTVDTGRVFKILNVHVQISSTENDYRFNSFKNFYQFIHSVHHHYLFIFNNLFIYLSALKIKERYIFIIATIAITYVLAIIDIKKGKLASI